MSTAVPVWTEATVLAPYAVIKAESYRTLTNLDLRAKHEGVLKLLVAAGGTTALTASSALVARIMRTHSNDATSPAGGAVHFTGSHTRLGKALINNGSNYAAGVVSIAYDGAGGTAFAQDDILCLTGVTTIPTASGAISTPTMEWRKLSKGAATPITFVNPTDYAHNDNEFIVAGSAWDIYLPGGATYALEIDHLQDIASEAMFVAAYIETLDSYTIS